MSKHSHPDTTDAIMRISRIGAVPQILETVAHITGLRFVAVAHVTDCRWTACAVRDDLGFDLPVGGELVLESTICNDIRQSHEPVIFGHASTHPLYSQHHTPRQYGLESYVSVPIFDQHGSFFGTLCAIDSKPADFDEAHVLRSLQLFAQLIGNYLDNDDRLQAAERAGELHDQFIAVLGHDLRSPLQAVRIGADLLQQEATSPRSAKVLQGMQKSLDRIDGLVHDILDFARGRLGGGIPVLPQHEESLAEQLMHVVSEVKAASGRNDIVAEIAFDAPVLCDGQRIAQLVTNLLANAAAHGSASQPVSFQARGGHGHLWLQVHNGGVIPQELRARLFTPFSRNQAEHARPGLGLGLYIAAEIAKAHGAELGVHSSAETGTIFTFLMGQPSTPVDRQHDQTAEV
ncbi:GAF domain-containing sensor histidine kinase [Pseudoxanthomonas dokdonensis]|uniref:histidine kinase n=1 Tax=Pseudoxanthomonas dokdonensis TaxID=344882 RepID=A0A0R0CLI0_9GAMM|nr:GAF domain-containing sensor histidine kinase [Pseudoxanthomonas dokdonensis]KRG70411.1 histidine kinase [Pseudoxanthomonas dokdonensis]